MRIKQSEYNKLLDIFNGKNKGFAECVDYLIGQGFFRNQANNAVHVYRKGRATEAKFRLSSQRRANLGTLKAGATADVTIFDPDAEWAVDPGDFVSKGRNTPLSGSVLKGRVMVTVFGGAVVYEDESVEVN